MQSIRTEAEESIAAARGKWLWAWGRGDGARNAQARARPRPHRPSDGRPAHAPVGLKRALASFLSHAALSRRRRERE